MSTTPNEINLRTWVFLHSLHFCSKSITDACAMQLYQNLMNPLRMATLISFFFWLAVIWSLPYIFSLYLDFNGILHACAHPTSKLFPPSSEVYHISFLIPDLSITIGRNVRRNDDIHWPSCKHYKANATTLYCYRYLSSFYSSSHILPDGVAPRAKMNQQRGRRFQAGEQFFKSKETIEQQFIQMEVFFLL